MEEVRERMRNVGWFRALSEGQLERLLKRCRRMRFTRYTTIVREGCVGSSLLSQNFLLLQICHVSCEYPHWGVLICCKTWNARGAGRHAAGEPHTFNHSHISTILSTLLSPRVYVAGEAAAGGRRDGRGGR